MSKSNEFQPIIAVSYSALTRYTPTHILSSRYAYRTLCGLSRFLPDADTPAAQHLAEVEERAVCSKCLKLYKQYGYGA